MTAKPYPQTGLPTLVGETPLTSQPPALVLFGRDGGSKPRAAWFDASDAEAATAAAVTTRLRVLPITDEAGRELARQLARGRVLPSGRAHAPFAKHDLYARLVALAGEDVGLHVTGGSTAIGADAAGDAREAAGDAPASGAPTGAPGASPAPRPGDRTFVGSPRPSSRDEVGLGSVVLAHESPEDGWWEAEVIGVNGPTLALRWVGWPTNPTVLRKAGELALLPLGES